MTKKTEKDILFSLKNGEEKAYEMLFGLYYSKVKSFILGLTKNHFVSDDLAQNVFMKLWLNRDKLDSIESISSYLYTISRNEVYDYFRREENVLKYINSLFEHSQTSCQIEHKYDLEAIKKVVDFCVSMMPPQRRMIYKMSREENLSNAEIAEKMNISKRTVDAHIHQAIKTLRSSLSKIIPYCAIFFMI